MKSNTINANTEKVFFKYITKNPHWFDIVEPSFFKTPVIIFMYQIAREAYKSSERGKVPSDKELYQRADLEDPSKNYSRETIKMILTSNIDNLSEEDYIIPLLSDWSLRNKFSIEYVKTARLAKEIRDEDLSKDDMEAKMDEIQGILDKARVSMVDGSQYPSSFDDPEAHYQEIPSNRISTGYKLLDDMLGGGWHKKTLNLFAGMSGSGKSLWMNNIAANAVRDGYNVLYVSLEMSEEKVMKRMGTNLLSIKADEYDAISRDSHAMSERVRRWRNSRDKMVEKPFGKFWVEDMPKATPADVDRLIELIEKREGVKIHMVCVDYTQIMSINGSKNMSMFEKGKEIAEQLRAIAMKRDLVMISGNQISKDQYEANRASLADLSESKAYGDTADFVFYIIRTEPMKQQSKYGLQGLKFRSTAFSTDRIFFDLNEDFLRIENDTISL